MRIVDFRTLPDTNELRDRLVRAFGEIDAGEAVQADPIEPSTPLGVGYPAELSDDDVRARADELRERLAAELGDEAQVRFDLADAQSATAGGAPDHVE